MLRSSLWSVAARGEAEDGDGTLAALVVGARVDVAIIGVAEFDIAERCG